MIIAELIGPSHTSRRGNSPKGIKIQDFGKPDADSVGWSSASENGNHDGGIDQDPIDSQIHNIDAGADLPRRAALSGDSGRDRVPLRLAAFWGPHV
jgi:hypothetical protein